MNNKVILATTLAFVCSTVAFAQGSRIIFPIDHNKVERPIISASVQHSSSIKENAYNAYLTTNQLASQRQATLKLVQEKIKDLAEGTSKREQFEYAQHYLETMNELLNRYTTAQSTKEDLAAIYHYKQGKTKEAYEALGFQLDKVSQALEAMDLSQTAQAISCFDWPEPIDWNNRK